jgi:hypothetical protein
MPAGPSHDPGLAAARAAERDQANIVLDLSANIVHDAGIERIPAMTTYTITIERISTGETAPSMVTRQASEAAARAYAEAAIAAQPDAADLRVHAIAARG